MPSSVAPKISWHQITGYSTVSDGTENDAIKQYDFTTTTVQDADVVTPTIRLRIRNDNECADAINPILYLAGVDKSKLSTEQWVQVKVVSDNGIEVSDTFGPLTDNPATTKQIHNNIESGTYLGIDTYVKLPGQTQAGRYSWQLILEYEYTV